MHRFLCIRQGNPLSPFLFILAIEALNVVLEDAENRHFCRGIEVGKDKIYVSYLQFADDAIILGELSTTNVKNPYDKVISPLNQGGLRLVVYQLVIKVGNGESTRFWIDKWVGNSPLCSSFPRLLCLDSNPLCRVCERSRSIATSGPLIVPNTGQNYNQLGISVGPAMA
ncbi:putative RNA-directed DNA polymerase, eukaryota, reverse transcriptase zinc-binding domain protein [Tanacetum coccineum]